MTTEKLYWQDPYRESFDAERCTLSQFGDAASLVCDATVFYPEAGGQLGDRGVLLPGGDATLALDVVDTQIDDVGVIHHILATMPDEPARAALGRGVRGRIDTARRETQRAQHTAQHMLSSALVREADAATVSARLGTRASTIDVSRDKLGDAELARAEDLVNALVRANHAVRAFFPDATALAALPLRRPPKVTESVRIVAVGDEGAWFDVTPCGGTHVARTGELGAVRVSGVERYKGMMRVTFLTGAEALVDARAKHDVLGALARDFSCSPQDVPAALARLRTDLKSERDGAAKLRAELAAALSEALLASLPPLDARADAPFVPLVVVRDGADVTFLRTLAGLLTARADVVAIVAAPSAAAEGTALVVQRGANARFDCGAFWKSLAASASGSGSGRAGRGGGSPARAEGRFEGTLTREFLETQLSVPEAGRT